MRLLKPKEAPHDDSALVFRNRSWTGLLIAAGLMGLVAGALAAGKWGQPDVFLAVLPGGLALLFLALSLLRLRMCLRPDNWLLRMGKDGLYVNLRSYRNHQLDGDAPTVLFIPRDEVAVVCKTHEVRTYLRRRGYTEEFFNYIDVYLHDGAGLAAVTGALRTERRRMPARGRKHHDYPVRVIDPPGIRLVWEHVRPGEDTALRLLTAEYPAGPAQKRRGPKWDKLNDAEKEAHIAELWETGYIDEANRMVRLHRTCSVREAREYLRQHVEEG